MRVELGNQHPVGLNHPSTTRIDIPNNATPAEAFANIADRDGIWANHSKDLRPAWILASNPELQQRLADYYGSPTGRPDDWKDTP